MGEGLGMRMTFLNAVRSRAGVSAIVLAGALVLTGCSGGKDAAPTQLELARATKAIVGGAISGKGRGEAPAPISRAQIEAVGLPVTGIRAERRAMSAYFFRAEARRDETPGLIEVWMSGDQLSTVTTRDGVVIATRGLGGDLLSSGVPLADGQPQSGALEQRIFTGDNRERSLMLRCETEDIGAERVDILGVSHDARHLRQSCDGGDGSRVTNDFWQSPGDGTIWKSRQWAGPYVGYLQLNRVTK